jgi:hypothetical protein
MEVDPNVTVPYWDWTYDGAKPEESIVFSSSWFGSGFGDNKTKCVVDGPFKDWVTYTPGESCLQRDLHGRNTTSWMVTGTLAQLLDSAKNYDNFTTQIIVPHSTLHVSVGGDFQSTYSPGEPLFWLHHSFIDKVWYDWEHIDNRSRTFPKQLENITMTPFGEVIAKDTLNSVNSQFCVLYEQPKAIRGQDYPNNGFKYSQPEIPKRDLQKPTEEWLKMNKIPEAKAEKAEKNADVSRNQVIDQMKQGEQPKALDESARFKNPLEKLGLQANGNAKVVKVEKSKLEKVKGSSRPEGSQSSTRDSSDSWTWRRRPEASSDQTQSDARDTRDSHTGTEASSEQHRRSNEDTESRSANPSSRRHSHSLEREPSNSGSDSRTSYDNRASNSERTQGEETEDNDSWRISKGRNDDQYNYAKDHSISSYARNGDSGSIVESPRWIRASREQSLDSSDVEELRELLSDSVFVEQVRYVNRLAQELGWT